MKKLRRIIALLLAVSLVAVSFSACSATGSSIVSSAYGMYENHALGCTFIYEDGKTSKSFELSGKMDENHFITVDLGKSMDYNTVVLQEKTQTVTLFQIYGSNELDSGYEFLYQSDTIEGGHTCFLGDVNYRYLRIIVNQSSGRFKINNIGVYNIKSDKAKDLRVNAYFVVADIKKDTDFSKLDGVTDIILFGTAKYDAKGNIYFVDREGNEVDEEFYSSRVDILRKAIGKRNINVFCDIAMPYGNDNADIISMMNDENVDNTVASIKAFVEKYDFDGFDMDYEFPYSKLEWKQFNGFLRKLDKAIPDRMISLAIQPWDLQFDEDVMQIIDRVEVMLYDMFTTHGYHSMFSTSVNGIDKTLKAGFKANQIDMGVPFYSRPTNRLAYWGSYSQFEDKIDRYTNLIYFNDFDVNGYPMTAPQYINSVQAISDKTAFAIDYGLGGMMIWHLEADLPYTHELSLFKAINDTKTAKQS